MPLKVRPSSDCDYFRKVFSNRGDEQAIEELLVMPNVDFYEVIDNDERKGLVVFRRILPEVAEIHVALKTVGRKTEQALRFALADMHAKGATLFVAMIPVGHRALLRLADVFGFTDAPQLAHFYPEWCKDNFTFKEFIWR